MIRPLRASPSAERLASKMAAAETRRRALEESQMQKFAAREEHAKQVRKRKATTSMELSA